MFPPLGFKKSPPKRPDSSASGIRNASVSVANRAYERAVPCQVQTWRDSTPHILKNLFEVPRADLFEAEASFYRR